MVHVGLDLHKKRTEVAVLDDSGQVVDRCKLEHGDKTEMSEYFRAIGRDGIATIEATRNWYWEVELLEECGLAVKLANPQKVRLIAEAKVKTDKVDAWTLAHLERTGFLPEAYIPPREVRDQRELLRYRLALVGIGTSLKNRVHALLDKLGIRQSFTDLFGKGGREFLAALQLRDVYRKTLDGYLASLDFVEAQVKQATRDIRVTLKADPRATVLMTIPGVGQLTAYLLLSEIGDIDRFLSAKKLCAYSGLVPRTYQSGDHCYSGAITRQGNRYIRYAMVEAAQLAHKRDPALGYFYDRLKRTKGTAKARVAVARKLLVAVYHVLKYGEHYRYNCLTKQHLGKPAFVSGHVT
jgi:transposase